jgi:hypothetical protein
MSVLVREVEDLNPGHGDFSAVAERDGRHATRAFPDVRLVAGDGEAYRVISGATHHRIARALRDLEGVITGTASKRIRAGPTHEDVLARPTNKGVVSSATREEVIARAAVEFIISVAAD